MNRNTKRTCVERQTLAFGLMVACLPGCGGCESYDPPAPPSPEKAAPETFEIRSLTANGQSLTTGGPVMVDPDAPVEIEADILFRKERPPFVHVQFINSEKSRDVIHDESFAKLPGATGRSSESSTFSATLDAPRAPGKYTIRVMAPPHDIWRNADPEAAPDSASPPRIYAIGELTVTE